MAQRLVEKFFADCCEATCKTRCFPTTLKLYHAFNHWLSQPKQEVEVSEKQFIRVLDRVAKINQEKRVVGIRLLKKQKKNQQEEEQLRCKQLFEYILEEAIRKDITTASEDQLEYIRKKKLICWVISAEEGSLNFKQSIAKTRERCRSWWEENPRVAEFRITRLRAAEEYERMVREGQRVPHNTNLYEGFAKQQWKYFLQAERRLKSIFLRVGSYFFGGVKDWRALLLPNESSFDLGIWHRIRMQRQKQQQRERREELTGWKPQKRGPRKKKSDETEESKESPRKVRRRLTDNDSKEKKQEKKKNQTSIKKRVEENDQVSSDNNARARSTGDGSSSTTGSRGNRSNSTNKSSKSGSRASKKKFKTNLIE